MSAPRTLHISKIIDVPNTRPTQLHDAYWEWLQKNSETLLLFRWPKSDQKLLCMTSKVFEELMGVDHVYLTIGERAKSTSIQTMFGFHLSQVREKRYVLQVTRRGSAIVVIMPYDTFDESANVEIVWPEGEKVLPQELPFRYTETALQWPEFLLYRQVCRQKRPDSNPTLEEFTEWLDQLRQNPRFIEIIEKMRRGCYMSEKEVFRLATERERIAYTSLKEHFRF